MLTSNIMTEEDNKTLWCGNLADQVTEELLYELFLQAGPLEKVRIPRDRDGRQKNFAFITYCHDVSVPYAITLFRGTALFHRTLSLQCRAKMALLPPPIRCFTLDQSFDFLANTNVMQQFSDMTQNFRNDNQVIGSPRQFQGNNELVVASLQGNWSQRHHPYRKEEKQHGRREESRSMKPQTNHKDRNRPNSNKNKGRRNNHVRWD